MLLTDTPIWSTGRGVYWSAYLQFAAGLASTVLHIAFGQTIEDKQEHEEANVVRGSFAACAIGESWLLNFA